MSDLMATMLTSSSNDLESSNSNNNPENNKDKTLKDFQDNLNKHRRREVLDLFKREVVPEICKNGSYIVWDLVPIICQRLRGLSEFRFKTFDMCRQILLDLCEICNPKELLIIYLSELENDLNITRYVKRDGSNKDQDSNQEENGENVDDPGITDSNCFKALLKPFEVILLKLPKKRNETLKSVLISLNEHISRLSISPTSNFDFENEDRVKLMLDPNIKSVNSVLSMYVDFLETFVKEVDLYNSNNQIQIHSKTSDPNTQRIILLKSLLLMLDYPLKYMDLYQGNANGNCPSQNAKPSGPNLSDLFEEDFITSRLIALKIVRLISCLHSNIYTLLNRTDLISVQEVNETHSDFADVYLSSTHFQTSMSVLCYLLATEPELSPSNFMPRVYTHIYNFGIHLPYIQNLLNDNQFLVYDKGFELLKALMEHIQEESLEVSFLDLIRQHPIDKALISIMILSSFKSSRLTALQLFKQLVMCFEAHGRYKFFYSILSHSDLHAGLQGVVVNMYKDLMFDHQVYQGTNLHRVVRAIISVSLLQENSDLLNKNDLIFGVLNFLRYIFIRDPKSINSTRIWDILNIINDNFIKPLEEEIELTRTNYKLELIRLTKLKNGEKSKRKKSTTAPKVELNIQNLEKNELTQHNLQQITIEQQHKEIMIAMQNYDLIESILVRLKEIINGQ